MALLDSLRISTENGAEFDPEFEEEFAPDPAPNEKPRRSRKEPVVKAPRRASTSTARLAKQVGDEIAGVIEMAAAGWAMAGDECCSPVLEAQAKPIGSALANILKRYPSLLAKLADSDWMAQGLSLAMFTAAVKPVVATVYRNHVAKEGDEDAPVGSDDIDQHFRDLTPSFR